MESILHQLNKQHIWQKYLEYKLEKDSLTKKEKQELIEFVELKKYEDTAKSILKNKPLSIPEKKLINKLGGKKRTVYSFQDDENKVLKLISYLLYKYDDKHSPGCYSFRKGFGVQKAVSKIVNIPNISKLWSYKLDIKDYFNSISPEILLPLLADIIDDDPLLLQFFMQMLSENKAIYEGNIIQENRGVMAGTPTSPFFANVYLKELDAYFVERDLIYARYSDDIIVFAETEEKLMEYRDIMHKFLSKYKLSVNTEKENFTKPTEAWEYLGIEYQNGHIDLSSSTKQKLKGKIRRKARALYRWKLKKDASDAQTMKVMIRVFNGKFFENSNPHNLTWSRWFFPLVTDKEGFQEIDSYLQQYIRYISTGVHSKKNYKVTYNTLKELGYRSLVNEYYKYKSQPAR
jgi:Reverse transcriptase (RNA-dependent DNA polymerase).